MKLLKFSLLLVLVSLSVACGDDESGGCSQLDWEGVYFGTVECNGVPEDAIITIVASSSDKVSIKYETESIEAQFDPLEFDGCKIDHELSDAGYTLTIDASLTNDTLFNMAEVIASSTGFTTCQIRGSK